MLAGRLEGTIGGRPVSITTTSNSITLNTSIRTAWRLRRVAGLKPFVDGAGPMLNLDCGLKVGSLPRFKLGGFWAKLLAKR